MDKYAIVYEVTTKCDAELYDGFTECHTNYAEFALIELSDRTESGPFHAAHLCSYHALPILLIVSESEYL